MMNITKEILNNALYFHGGKNLANLNAHLLVHGSTTLVCDLCGTLKEFPTACKYKFYHSCSRSTYVKLTKKVTRKLKTVHAGSVLFLTLPGPVLPLKKMIPFLLQKMHETFTDLQKRKGRVPILPKSLGRVCTITLEIQPDLLTAQPVLHVLLECEQPVSQLNVSEDKLHEVWQKKLGYEVAPVKIKDANRQTEKVYKYFSGMVHQLRYGNETMNQLELQYKYQGIPMSTRQPDSDFVITYLHSHCARIFRGERASWLFGKWYRLKSKWEKPKTTCDECGSTKFHTPDKEEWEQIEFMDRGFSLYEMGEERMYTLLESKQKVSQEPLEEYTDEELAVFNLGSFGPEDLGFPYYTGGQIQQ